MRKLWIIIISALWLINLTSCEAYLQARQARKLEKTMEKELQSVEKEEGVKEFEANQEGAESNIHPNGLPYRPVRTRTNDILHTKLAISFDWKNRRVQGKAWLTVKPYFYPVSFLELDAQTFDIHALELIKPDGTRQKLKYEYDNKLLKITLDKTYSASEEYQIYIDYTAKPYEKPEGGGFAVTSDRGLFFINHDGSQKNVPQQIWTQGETSWNSCWFPTFDHPSEKTTEEIEITVDNKFVTISNGAKIKSEVHPDGTRTDYWKMEKPHSPYLFALAVGEFGEYKDTWRGKEVNYYLEKKYAPYAKAIFGNTPEMLEFFSTRLGVDYPWEKYAQVVVREFVSGAMENTTCTIFFDEMNMDDRELLDGDHEDIIAHELFHHWFGDYVTCESYANLALNESFASYSEYLWDEHKYGKDKADAHLYDDMMAYMMEANWKKVPIIRFHYNNEDDMFDAHSYQKGACVLHTLRNYVGDSAFFVSLNRYLNQYAMKNAEIHQLRIVFEETTGEDLNWFFNQWFLSPGHPEVEYDYNQIDKKVAVTARQVQSLTENPLFRLKFRIQVTDEAGKSVYYPVEMLTQDTTFTLSFSGKAANVILDSDGVLLGEMKRLDGFTSSKMRNQYLYGGGFRSRSEAIDYLSSEYSPESEKTLLEATRDPYAPLRLNALATLDYGKSKQKDVLLGRAFEMTKDSDALVRSLATSIFKEKAIYNKLQSSPEWRTKVDSLIHRALNDRSYSVLGNGLAVANVWNKPLAEAFVLKLDPKKDNSSFLFTGIGVLLENLSEINAKKVMEIIQGLEEGNEKFYILNTSLRIRLDDVPANDPGVKSVMEGLIKIAENEEDADIRAVALDIMMGDKFFSLPIVKAFFMQSHEQEKNEKVSRIYREAKKKLQ
ncbi:MAG: M1 family metallopeptidase [Bacteroidia bacterium]|nr:M1 family metallopeptidase [Bacteroidia bacterium]